MAEHVSLRPRRRSAEIQALVDEELELALVGQLLYGPSAVAEICQVVTWEDFWNPAAGLTFRALVELHLRDQKIDTVAVADLVAIWAPDFDRRLLVDWMGVHGVSPARAAERLSRLSLGRKARQVFVDRRSDLIEGVDPSTVIEQARSELGEVFTQHGPASSLNLTLPSDVLSRDGERPRWLIPGIMWRNEAVVFVASEGAGKSTLGRQLAVCAEAGLHPFVRSEVPRIKVLSIDLENKPQAVKGQYAMCLKALRQTPGFETWTPSCPVWEQPNGIDLLSALGQRQFAEAVRRTEPDLVIMGPLYKCYRVARGQDGGDEVAALAVTNFLDDLRQRYGFGLWLEAHAPHGDDPKHRTLRPFGSSLWMRWPEQGRWMRPDPKGGQLDLGVFRGDRSPVNWPKHLVKGKGGWPFTGFYDELDLRVNGYRG